jgi:hypothetical protein
MKPAEVELTIYQGSTYHKKFTWETQVSNSGVISKVPVDLTGYTMRMQIRAKITDPEIILELTTENGRINITNPTSGEFSFDLPEAVTSELNFKSAVYDLEVISGPVVNRLLFGSVSLSKECTRPVPVI